MKKTLRVKLSLSFILVTVICVVLISFLSNLFLTQQFKDYVIQQQQRANRNIVETVNQQFLANGKWNFRAISEIGVEAIDEGLFITIKDSSGNIVWDASEYDYDMCEVVKKRLTANMLSRYPNWQAMYTEDQYDVVSNSETVGVVEIGYLGPYYYNDNDIIYLNTLNKIIIGVGFFTLLIALTLGLLIARGLSIPILSVVNTAKMISRGNYYEKVTKNTDIEEIQELISTINDLGGSLNEQENLRKRLTRDVSHELRTPLTTLHSHMEAMIDGLWEPTTERLISCQEEIKRLERLVGDLANLTKYDSENIKLDKMNFNLCETIKNIVLNFENEFLNLGVKLKFHEKDIIAYADKDKISQVIVNLLSNALKCSKRGDEVEIFINEDKENTTIQVKDTGIGISELDLPHIFERFYRADESRNRKTGGAGIGLTIAKSIVEAHGGTINVKTTLGEGSEFTVKILKN